MKIRNFIAENLTNNHAFRTIMGRWVVNHRLSESLFLIMSMGHISQNY